MHDNLLRQHGGSCTHNDTSSPYTVARGGQLPRGSRGWESCSESWLHEYGNSRGVHTNHHLVLVPCLSFLTDDMTDTPGSNTTPLPTELSSLHQLPEESEYDNDVPFPTAPDAQAEAGGADQNQRCSYDFYPTVPRIFF